MNDNSLKLPIFKYHPNVYDKEKVLDAVQFDNNVCQCYRNMPTNIRLAKNIDTYTSVLLPQHWHTLLSN